MADGASEHFDILIVGAGISGIDAAYHLQKRMPGKSYAILDARERIGGTWDLFRYPGIRSDSDMYTLGFPFRPWCGDKAIAGGAEIRDYVEETAREFGIDRRIRFRHCVTKASWSSSEARWFLETETDEGTRRFSCGFLFLCSGYYDYAGGHRPAWPGEAGFRGRFVHPQQWPDDLDVADRRIAVIGSGATAVTIVPALAEAGAAHVTMVQRSPSYVVSLPSRDGLARTLGARLTRAKNVLISMYFFNRARRKPDWARDNLLALVRAELPAGYDVDRHFTPRYKPWDQRMCVVPDGDLFAAIRAGRVSVATGEIETFTPDGLRLRSGEEIAADIVVTATGLALKLLGGIALDIDGAPADAAGRLVYKGMMLENLPNLAFSFGYTNASWTLKCDLSSRYLCRLLRYMDAHGHRICVPRVRGEVERRPLLEFTSGYIARADAALPRQGDRKPWRVPQNYVRDVATLGFGRVADEEMEFR